MAAQYCIHGRDKIKPEYVSLWPKSNRKFKDYCWSFEHKTMRIFSFRPMTDKINFVSDLSCIGVYFGVAFQEAWIMTLEMTGQCTLQLLCCTQRLMRSVPSSHTGTIHFWTFYKGQAELENCQNRGAWTLLLGMEVFH